MSLASQRVQLFFIFSTAFVLFACGGGGGNDVPVPQEIPTLLVNAGQNITVEEGELVSLNGSASGGDGEITFAWSSSSNIEFQQVENTAATASLTAPLSIQDMQYELILTATDARGVSSRDSITLSVTAVNSLPVADIQVTQATGYAQNTFPVLSTIELSGALSTDDDPLDTSAASLTYQWRQISGESVLTDVETSEEVLVFSVGLSQFDYTLVFELAVTDQDGAVDTEQVTLTMLQESKTIPQVSMGPVISVLSGEKVNLSAIAQSIAPNASPFTFSWTDDYTNDLDYHDATNPNTFAVAPDVTTATDIVFSIDARDQFGNVATNNVTMTVIPFTFETINDTGVTLDGSANRNTEAYQSDYPGQDGHRGKDIIAKHGLTRKAGSGTVGFDFTRLDLNGAELDDDALPWNCVRDNITGLVWQVKSPSEASDLHSAGQRFTWFSESDNGDFEGVLNPSNESCNIANSNCNTQAYTLAVNEQGLCGFFDWRIPSPDELMSLVHFGKTSPPLIDTDFFLNLEPDDTSPMWFWTNQSNADGVTETGAQSVWAIDFASGVDGFLSKGQTHRLMLVRAGRTVE
jgi:hypothetical protein